MYGDVELTYCFHLPKDAVMAVDAKQVVLFFILTNPLIQLWECLSAQIILEYDFSFNLTGALNFLQLGSLFA